MFLVFFTYFFIILINRDNFAMNWIIFHQQIGDLLLQM